MEREEQNKFAVRSTDETLGGNKPLRCIVKLGGAAITCKNELESINEEILRSVCAQLREAMSASANSSSGTAASMDWSRRSGYPPISAVEEYKSCQSFNFDNNFIIVHGAGSFGHFQASTSGVHKGGLCHPLVKAGFVATRISVTSLNLEIVRALAREGIPSVGISPFACGWSTKGRNVASADISHVTRAVHSGFVPILHGDAVLDELQDCTILSGDVIIRHLSHLLMPNYVVFLVSTLRTPLLSFLLFNLKTDVLGVYDRPPTDPNATLLRKIAVDSDGNWSIVKPQVEHEKMGVEITVAAHDTTGGMETKIAEAAMIAMLGINVYITKAGTPHSLRALRGEVGDAPDDWLGTVICSSKHSQSI